MIVDKIWKLTNVVRVGLDPRSSYSQRQATFPDNVCSSWWAYEYGRGNKARTTSDDAGGPSVSENSCIKSLSEDASIKQTWLVTGNV